MTIAGNESELSRHTLPYEKKAWRPYITKARVRRTQTRKDTSMPGTHAGGSAAAETNKKRHGEDFYKRIGAIGGRKGHTGGFAADRALARRAGAKGGRISRRRKATAPTIEAYEVRETEKQE